MLRQPLYESFWMFLVRLGEDVATRFSNAMRLPGVEAVGCEIPDVGMFVHLVVPLEEAA